MPMQYPGRVLVGRGRALVPIGPDKQAQEQVDIMHRYKENAGRAAGLGSAIIRLAEGTTLDHFNLQVSADGQCLLVYCADDLVAMHSAMGSDVDEFHFPDGTRYSLMELIRRLGQFVRGAQESDDA